MNGEDEPAGTVTIGMNKQPICVPGNSTITVPGKLSKLVKNGSYLVESAAHNNLCCGKSQLCYFKGRTGGGDTN